VWAWLPSAGAACGAATLEGGRAAVLASAASPTAGALLYTTLSALMAPLAEASRRTFGDGALRHSDWLSPREQEVLSALLLGKSIREIAVESGRSAHTVHDHVKNLHRKLRANSRGELVARALGHIEPSPGPGTSAPW
ncbi:MAG: helix-turn-helix transcriptional regulator, partial [Phycisphaerales bacterium]